MAPARILPFVCLASLLAASALAARGQAEQPPPRVGEIEVVTHEVFEERPNAFGALYRLANKLHIRTRQGVIRRELLFAPGDELKPELLAQTERNLRALAFVRDARVETLPVDENGDGQIETVNVRVTTWDAWSTSPVIGFARVGDEVVWQIGASEENLLGLGKEVRASRRKSLDRTSTTFLYRDRQLAASRFMLSALVAKQSDGGQGAVILGRPFFSLEDDWAGGLRVGAFVRRDPLFLDGNEVARLRHVGRWADLEFARALVRRPNRALRLQVAYRVRQEHVAGDVRDFGILEVGIGSVAHDFVKLTHVNRFERTEDFNLGAASSAAVGISTPRFGGSKGTTLFFSLARSQGARFGAAHLLIASMNAAARHRSGRLENVLTAGRLRYLRKHAIRHGLVGTAEFRHGVNLDREIQLLLGAESGLRGYPVRQFAGTRSLLLSGEERWFMADDIGQLVSFGLAAFVDSGFAWPQGQSINISDLRTSVGVGLLVGRSRLSTTMPGLRLDLAYALDPVAATSRWVFTSGSAIAF